MFSCEGWAFLSLTVHILLIDFLGVIEMTLQLLLNVVKSLDHISGCRVLGACQQCRVQPGMKLVVGKNGTLAVSPALHAPSLDLTP